MFPPFWAALSSPPPPCRPGLGLLMPGSRPSHDCCPVPSSLPQGPGSLHSEGLLCQQLWGQQVRQEARGQSARRPADMSRAGTSDRAAHSLAPWDPGCSGCRGSPFLCPEAQLCPLPGRTPPLEASPGEEHVSQRRWNWLMFTKEAAFSPARKWGRGREGWGWGAKLGPSGPGVQREA